MKTKENEIKKHLKVGVIAGEIADIIFLAFIFILKTITGKALDPKSQINLNYPRNVELFSIAGLTLIEVILGLIILFVAFFAISSLISWLIEKSKKSKKN